MIELCNPDLYEVFHPKALLFEVRQKADFVDGSHRVMRNLHRNLSPQLWDKHGFILQVHHLAAFGFVMGVGYVVSG